MLKKLKEAKELDFTKESFEANGTTYWYFGSIEKFGIDRYVAWQDHEPTMTFGKSFQQVHGELGKGIELINKQKAVQGYSILYNLYENIGDNMDGRIDNILRGCCYFMVTEGENLNELSEATIKTKITDWKKEGIAYQSFFSFALGSIPGYMKAYLEHSRKSLKQENQKEQKRKRTTSKG